MGWVRFLRPRPQCLHRSPSLGTDINRQCSSSLHISTQSDSRLGCEAIAISHCCLVGLIDSRVSSPGGRRGEKKRLLSRCCTGLVCMGHEDRVFVGRKGPRVVLLARTWRNEGRTGREGATWNLVSSSVVESLYQRLVHASNNTGSMIACAMSRYVRRL